MYFSVFVTRLGRGALLLSSVSMCYPKDVPLRLIAKAAGFSPGVMGMPWRYWIESGVSE